MIYSLTISQLLGIIKNNFNGRAKKMSNIDDVLRLIDLELRRHGWFRTDLAKALGKSDAWLSKILNKKRGISYPLYQKFVL